MIALNIGLISLVMARRELDLQWIQVTRLSAQYNQSIQNELAVVEKLGDRSMRRKWGENCARFYAKKKNPSVVVYHQEYNTHLLSLIQLRPHNCLALPSIIRVIHVELHTKGMSIHNFHNTQHPLTPILFAARENEDPGN
jgi:hypothetical protein